MDGRLSTFGRSIVRLFRFAVKLRNSAGVLPQFDIASDRHLFGAFLGRIVVEAFEVDSLDVMAVRGDKIRSVAGHGRCSQDRREHAGLSVTDGSQQRAMIESLCSAFMFRARPNGTLGHFMMPHRTRTVRSPTSVSGPFPTLRPGKRSLVEEKADFRVAHRNFRVWTWRCPPWNALTSLRCEQY